MIKFLPFPGNNRAVALVVFTTLWIAIFLGSFAVGEVLSSTSGPTQDPQEVVVRPNFRQAQQYSPEYLRQRTYSSSVQPSWIGKTDQFWYSYRTSNGTDYYLVDPDARTRKPLFDHVQLAAALSQELRKPLEEHNLSLERVKIDEKGEKLTFNKEKTKFELDLTTGQLTSKGEVPKDEQRSSTRRGSSRNSSNRGAADSAKKDPRAHRNFSPDRSAYLFIQGFNLYYVEASDEVKAEIKVIDERMKKEKAEKEAKEKAGDKSEDTDEKDTDEKDTDEKDTDEKDTDEKDTDEKDTDEKDTDEKDTDEKDTDEKDTDEKDTDEKDTEEKDTEEKDTEEKDTEEKDTDEKDTDEKDTEEKDTEEKDTDEKDTDEKDTDEEDSDKKDTDKKDQKKEEEKVDEREKWADDIDESTALQLTDDGEEGYEFSARRSFRRGSLADMEEDAYLELIQAGEIGSYFDEDDDSKKEERKKDEKKGEEDEEGKQESEEEKKEDPKSRPSISWAPDSTAFYVTRRDSRGVGELFLVNSLSEPRPTLEKYRYSLPGEEKVGASELHIFDRNRKELFQMASKWKDEGYQSLHWPRIPYHDPEDESTEPDVEGSGDELRFIRRDRLLRNIELCSLDTRTGDSAVLIEEGFEGANIAPKSIRYLKKRNEMIWWSERSGWGHYYLYTMDGKFKNPITSGIFRASQIVDVDEDKGLLYFKGNGREPGENIYFQHLYSIFLDGTDLTLLDSGDANHRSVLSPTKKYIIDNCSRIDMAPISRICNSAGDQVMNLEESDLSRLTEAGWKMPETFTFKAADGVTELYGNMWKPFDFDPKKKYPIIAEVYPGPQTEGVSHSFSASNGRQQLAQIGFIVVQLGHRGGTPGRSKAYHSYGYYNLRDYGLADKKAGIEQLADMYPFIDIERVGIYGHSGGGFMSAAALLQEPYNDFFTVGVASSGNHDNNVYQRGWAERYHGLKEVAIKEKEKDKKGKDQEKSDTSSAFDDGDEKKVEDENKDTKKDDVKKEDDEGKKEKKDDEEKTRFEIHVPTNAELAANLKGKLLLVHGDMDNNVHPAGTMRLVNELIKANKRFDMLLFPGKRHGFGSFSGYFTQRKWEFFAEHLLGDHQTGADILIKQ
ncbi:MAG: prolyl oligopeptidase family serine peptidase [Planctomycetota bacterium]|nr:prolyl oligopeptidase family serine peptidase [Planctomycetota bacterium]